MHNPFSWFDQKMLYLTESFAKKFNWFTGKDNFWLAKALIVEGNILVIVIGYFLTMPINQFYFLLFLAIFDFQVIGSINNVQKRRMHEQISRAKDWKINMHLKYLRAWLFPLVIVTASLVFIYGQIVWSPLFIYSIHLLLIVYLLSIDTPPLNRAHAFEWLKSLKFSPKKTVALKPVPVPS